MALSVTGANLAWKTNWWLPGKKVPLRKVTGIAFKCEEERKTWIEPRPRLDMEYPFLMRELEWNDEDMPEDEEMINAAEDARFLEEMNIAVAFLGDQNFP